MAAISASVLNPNGHPTHAHAYPHIVDLTSGAGCEMAVAQRMTAIFVVNLTAPHLPTSAPTRSHTSLQALALWKKARRDQAFTAKAALLATQTCTSTPITHHNFTLDNGYASAWGRLGGAGLETLHGAAGSILAPHPFLVPLWPHSRRQDPP